MKKMLKKEGEKILDLLYPHTCPFCGEVTERRICRTCAREVWYIREPRCKKCGKPIRSESSEYCFDCLHTRHFYERGLSLWKHEKQVRTSIYRFKYQNRRIYSRFYTEELAKKFGKYVVGWRISLIIPIPLSRKRKKQRGFNQADLLAEGLSQLLGIMADTVHLQRTVDTIPQKELGNRERRENLKNAFWWTGKELSGRNVLLVDDIYTTGNTIDSAARSLKKAGAEKVYFLTISIGQGY